MILSDFVTIDDSDVIQNHVRIACQNHDRIVDSDRSYWHQLESCGIMCFVVPATDSYPLLMNSSVQIKLKKELTIIFGRVINSLSM